MFNIGDLYRKLVAVNDNEFEFEYFRIIDWWKEETFTYVRIENTSTGARFDIDVELMRYMEKVV